MEDKNTNSGCSGRGILIIATIAFVVFTCASRQRVGAKCWDGSRSYSTGRGTCSHHGGVLYWKYEYWWEK